MNYKQIKEALEYGSSMANGNGLQLLFVEGFDPQKWETIRTAPFYQDMLAEIADEGERLLHEPIVTLPYSLYKIFDETGSRKEFQQLYFARRLRLNVFAILAKVYGDKKYVEALEDIIWAMCDEYTWCLPAHLGGNSTSIIEAANAEVGAAPRKHRHTVDLFAAETAFALAEITGMLEQQLADIVVYRTRREVLERVLEPYCSIDSAFHWEFATMNWASVCAAGVGAAAMYILKDDRALTPIIQRLLGTMDCFLGGYQDDGACTEGINYWNYGFGFFVYFAELLKQRTAGRIDLMQNEKVKQIALFQQKSYLSEDYVVSFSDAKLKAKFMPGLTHHLKQTYAEVELPPMKYRSALHDDHCYRWAPMVRNLVWARSDYTGSGWGTGVYYMKDSGILVSRKAEGGRVVCFAAKGGHNNEPHNQNDIGSFILHVNGETLLTDPGSGEYTKMYFGPQRYSYISNSSRGHSVPIVEGGYQEPGKERRADIIDFSTDEERDILVMDIAKAYNNDNLRSLLRGFTFDKTGRGKLHLTDRYTFDRAPSGIVERFVSFQRPQLLEPGRVRIEGLQAVDLRYDAAKLACSIERIDFVNSRAKRLDLYLLDLAVGSPGASEQVEICIEW